VSQTVSLGGYQAMLDHNKLEAPRFDESACANAQPVQPLPINKTPTWVKRLRSARLTLNRRTRALALVIIVGLASGSLGGTLLVNQYSEGDNESAIVSNPVVEESPASAPNEMDELTTARTTVVRSPRRYRRSRVTPQNFRRAYRVAVITSED
jgi:hypothetical protein